MSNNTYFKITGIIFIIVAFVHLWRAFTSTALVVGDMSIPVVASWIGFIVAGFIAYQGLKKR